MARYGDIGSQEISHRFGYHKATDDTMPLHRETRALFQEFAEDLDQLLPAGRAKAVAFTELEAVSMWAHKAIAELAPVVIE